MFYFYIPFLNGSFPQSIGALAMGFVMSIDKFKNSKQFHDIAKQLAQYKEIIGIMGMIIGLAALI